MKTSNSIALQYEDITVHFNGDAWFNATEVAAKYGRRVNDWLNLVGTKEYIDALCQEYETGIPGFVFVKKKEVLRSRIRKVIGKSFLMDSWRSIDTRIQGFD